MQDNGLPQAGHGQAFRGFAPRSPENSIGFNDDRRENLPSSTLHDDRCNDQPAFETLSRIGSVGLAAFPVRGDGNLDTSCSGLDQTLFEQPATGSATSLPAAGLVAFPLPQTEISDSSLTRTTLATCGELRFAPTTRKLLEDCKINRGNFLHAIKDANVVFPNNQGWQAALATKKDNADIRDLMKIYHRFECYNIYRHVVEAGYHTGSCWIRDMRASLIDSLCRNFPRRFNDQKTANRCLNWVDQGCKYHEWVQMLGETSDLGYLIGKLSFRPIFFRLARWLGSPEPPSGSTRFLNGICIQRLVRFEKINNAFELHNYCHDPSGFPETKG